MSTDVKQGYKRTEVGVIPIDWDIDRFGEIALLERGKFSARPRNDPKYFGGQTPFIQTGDVTNSSGFVTDYSQTLNEAGLAVSKVFKKDTLFFTIAANIGDVAFAAFDAACPDSLIGITPKLSAINRGWLFHELRSRKRNFEGLATQNAQLNINLEKLNPYQLPIPPIKEQEAIASALSDMDTLISGLDQLIAKKLDIRQASMQQLLTGQRRLPGFSGEWTVKRLGDHLSFLRNGTNSRAELSNEGDVRYLHYGDIHGSHHLLLNPTSANGYPGSINSNARKALYDNLGQNACLALAVDAAVLDSRQDDWRGNAMKIKRVRLAIKNVLDQWGKDSTEPLGDYMAGQHNEWLESLLELVKHQHEY